MPLKIPWRNALVVFVNEAEEVNHGGGAVGSRRSSQLSATGEAAEEPGVESLCVGGSCKDVTFGGPAGFSNDYWHGGVACCRQRRHQRVEIGVEHVSVLDSAVDDWGGTVEEGKVNGEVLVCIETEERVDVDREGGVA